MFLHFILPVNLPLESGPPRVDAWRGGGALNHRKERGIKLGLKNRKASTAGMPCFVLHNSWRSIKIVAYFYQEMDSPRETDSNGSLRSWGQSGEVGEEQLYLEAQPWQVPPYKAKFVLMFHMTSLFDVPSPS